MSSLAWSAALVLLDQYADRLTFDQHIACRLAVMAGPGAASLELIPLAIQIMGTRI
jgi:hypothetical protein